MEKKIVVLGLDGATFDLLNPWIEAGHLPNLSRLLESGSSGVLQSTIPWTTIPAWTTFATGKDPGNHGCFDFRLPTDSLSRMQFVDSYDIPGKTFYELLVEADKKVTLINLPPSFPPRIPETVVTSLMTKGSEYYSPKNLAIEVPELNEYVIAAGDRSIDSIREVARKRFAVSKKLFQREWDFFFAMFSGSDHISHEFFSEMMGTSSPIGPGQLFVDLDGYIGWFLDNLPPGASVMLVSDHGFMTIRGMFYVNSWLAQEGYLKTGGFVRPDRVNFPGIEDSTVRDESSLSLQRARDFLFEHPRIFRVGKRIYHRFHRMIPVRPDPGSIGIDLSQSVAYAATNECKGIYINDSHRFIDGMVAPKDVDNLREEIVDKLQNLVNPKNGQKVFRRVWRREEIYGGPFSSRAPDIIFEQDQFVNFLLRSVDPFEDITTNYHSREGIFLACGDEIAAGKKVENAQIADMAPTILHLLGLAVPEDMDGKVLFESLSENSEAIKRKIVQGHPTGLKKLFERDYDPAEVDLIDSRLRALGY